MNGWVDAIFYILALFPLSDNGLRLFLNNASDLLR
jgi:hypothetical protein